MFTSSDSYLIIYFLCLAVKLIGKLQDGTVFLKKGHGEGEEPFEFKTDEGNKNSEFYFHFFYFCFFFPSPSWSFCLYCS